MPLTRKVAFQTVLQKSARLNVPRLIRGEFKLEPDQLLSVGIASPDIGCGWQHFYAKMNKSGYILIPKTAIKRLQEENENLAGNIFEVTLEPPL